MAGRGSNHFLRSDARRAIRSAREAGLEPTGLDVIINPKDGTTTFRVYSANAGRMSQPAGEAAWNEATEHLKQQKSRKATKAKR